jgi:nucleotide-binding universal stress UspA family protein
VAVSVGVAGVDAGCLDRQLEVGVRGVVGVELAGAFEIVERAADLGEHRVAGDEADSAVGRVADDVNERVLAQAPYVQRSGRDTTNSTDEIFGTGGEPAVIDVASDSERYLAAICLVLPFVGGRCKPGTVPPDPNHGPPSDTYQRTRRLCGCAMLTPVSESVDAVGPEGLQTVILPVDGSTESLAALPTARAAARRFQARLIILFVASSIDVEDVRERIEAELGELAVGETAEVVEVVVGDDPARSIVDHAHSLPRSIVCMSTRGRGRVVGSFVGSVTRSVVGLSAAPILVVGPQADRPGWLDGRTQRRPATWPEPLSTGDVVACVDGSVDSEAALPYAARWAAALAVPLTILTVAEDSITNLSGHRSNRFGPSSPEQYVEDLARRHRSAASHVVGQVQYDPISVQSGVRSFGGSHPVGLVVLAAHARTGRERLRFGATAAEIVAASTAPALVVPVSAR